MLYFNQQNQRGFTLIEIIVTLVIVGVLAAVAVPSFESLYNRNKINKALTEVEGALKEAQREAVKRGKKCEVTLDNVNHKVTGPCSLERVLAEDKDGDGVIEPPHEGVFMSFNGTLATTTFSFQGTTTDNGTIVLYQFPSANSYKRCLVISNGPGIMRTGYYNASLTSPINADECQ